MIVTLHGGDFCLRKALHRLRYILLTKERNFDKLMLYMREGNRENLSWFGPEIYRSQEALVKKGDFWFGEDVTAKETVVEASRELPTAKKIKLKLRKGNLPDINELSLATLHLLRSSTRSCYAQVGLEVQPGINSLKEEDIQKIIHGEEISCPAIAINYSRRAIKVDGPVLRFFWLDAKKHLTGDKLTDAVKTMRIDGKEGEDWFLGSTGEEGAQLSGGTVDKDTPITLGLRIKDTRLWIPFPSVMDPVKVDSKKDLPKYLKPVPDGLSPDFMICETVPVSMPNNLVGVINLGVHDKGGRHSGSPLIDPGFKGPIRLEIIKPGQHPDFVEMLMYEHQIKN